MSSTIQDVTGVSMMHSEVNPPSEPCSQCPAESDAKDTIWFTGPQDKKPGGSGSKLPITAAAA